MNSSNASSSNTPVTPGARGVAARVAFGALFVVVLPALLVFWARALDAWVPLPALGTRAIGLAFAAAGVALMLAGTSALWRFGRGLPMSAFPPEQLVTRGVYRYVADPLYVGAVAVSVGVSLATQSPAGLWIVSPLFALVCAAWVVGFERDATRQRFGAIDRPVLRLPRANDGVPCVMTRASVYVLVLLPWLVLYLAVERLGVPPDARELQLAFDAAIPVIPWTEGVYWLAYPMVVLAPLVARRERVLRQFAVRGLVATAFIVPIYLLVPVVFTARPVEGVGLWQSVMQWERLGDAPVTAFPAFHVVWACIAAELYAASVKGGRWAWVLVVPIAASCVTTGMHSVLDVIAGAVAYLLVANGGRLWRAVLVASEATANSWTEVMIGPVRVINHGLYAGLSVVVAVPIALWMGGVDIGRWIVLSTLVGLVAAALWAQLIEGSPQLLRPFGYFGAVFGVIAGVAMSAALGADGWRLLATSVVALAFGQAIARLRCLVNGCCHGRATDAALGIRYTHPRTRPVRLAGLGGVSIHPTQVYALLFTLFIGIVLMRLWLLHAPLAFIAGMYFILVGVGRFVEEHFRGEPQTATIGGLRLYQWLTIAFIVGGAALTTVRSAPAPAPSSLDTASVVIAVALGLVCFAAAGVDLPGSGRRFSRLA